jgi:hypothetical protein
MGPFRLVILGSFGEPAVITARLRTVPREYVVGGNSMRLLSREILRLLPDGTDIVSHLSATWFVHRDAS